MNDSLKLQKNTLIFGVPLFIIGLMIFVSNTAAFQMNPDPLSIGITVDLLLIVPLVYFLLIRKTRIPKTTIVPCLILGVVVCSLILPQENQHYLSLFKTWVLPVVELSVVAYVIYSLRKVIKSYKKTDDSIDFLSALKITCSEILPKPAVMPVVTEIAVFYYGFIHWKKRELKENEFSYHKESGTIALLATLLFLIVAETAVFHILLIQWSSVAAWILTFLSVYSGFQILGFLRSMLKRPISIEQNQLCLRYGIMSESTIDLDQIESVEISSMEITPDEKTRKLSILGDLESHNVIIHLKGENELGGLYGIKKKYRTLAFYVDDTIGFQKQLNKAISLC